jgi:predicted O-linked N-acetylglucosamine transferase (SPINDLY family)
MDVDGCQVNSQKQEADIAGGGNVRPRREDYGLPPEPALVFSCFNSLYKIDPPILTVWINILRRVPGSVLWLLEMPLQAKPQIVREAAVRGVPPGRIIFSTPIPHPQHLARAALADVFLDTLNYNAHTTATDALWTGVPMVRAMLAALYLAARRHLFILKCVADNGRGQQQDAVPRGRWALGCGRFSRQCGT